MGQGCVRTRPDTPSLRELVVEKLEFFTYFFIILLIIPFWIAVGFCRTVGSLCRACFGFLFHADTSRIQRQSRQRPILGYTLALFTSLLGTLGFPFFAPGLIAIALPFFSPGSIVTTAQTGITLTIVIQSLIFGLFSGMVGFGLGTLLDRLVAESK